MSTLPPPSIPPSRTAMRDSPSLHRPPSPPPLTPAGSSWTQHELEQGIEGELEQPQEQHRTRSSRDSGISLGERQQHDSPGSNARDELNSRPPDSAQRALSPYSSTSGPASSIGATSPSSAHARPPSALSSTSSSHPNGSGSGGGPASQHSLSSPRLVAPPYAYASSSLSSAAAFDYDDLLGPHPRRALSGTSVSPPSSTEDDKVRRAEVHVQGLGLTARGGGAAGRELYGQREGDELGGADDDAHGDDDTLGDEPDERWESLRTMSLSSAPTSAATDAPTAPRRSSLAQYAVRQSSFSSAALAGSPLSPHVAPFAPSSTASAQQGGAGTPTSASGGSWISPREREASWNSAASSSYASQAQQRALPSLASPSSATSPHTPGYSMSYASQHCFSHYGESSASASSAPLVAPAMSESSSRGAHGLGGETFFVSRGPPRAPYSVEYRDRSGSESYHLDGHSYSSLVSTGLDSSSAAAATYDQAMQADVSTIFVVGFPDDMTEREFSNMFAFADGFEAATLKFPYPRDGSVAGSEGGGLGMGTDDPFPSSSSSSYPGQPYLATAHEGFATSSAAGGTGASTPLSTTASATGTSTPASTSARKIIGFARFDTRQHALAARDTLSGRRVDYERGSVLKAEMAKKNLHMRKNVVVTATAMSGSGSGGSGATTGSGLSSAAGTTAPGSTTGYGSTQAQQQQQQSPYVYSALHGSPVAVQQAPSSASSSAPEAAAVPASSSSSAPGGSTGPSIPLSSLDAATLQKLAQSSNLNPAVLAEIARQNLVKTQASADSAATEAYHARRASEYFEYDPASASPFQSEQLGWAQAPLSTSSSSPQPQPSAAPGIGLGFGSQRSMLQQLDEGVVSNATASSAPYPSPSLGGGPGSSVSGGGSAGARSREASYASMSGPIGAPNPYSTYASPGPGAAPLSPGLAAAAASAATAIVGAVPSAAARQAAMHPLGSPTSTFSSPALGSALAALRTQNPADMNAPKNTLYVGGLPAVLPSLTGPFSASHLEDSLRNAFSRCPGYRRLQFRYKSNGPIVFVEFVDTAHATRAMQELYGHTLGGLVKGGIRLSYSKNPLGVRSNGQPALPPPELIDQRPPHHVLAAHQQHAYAQGAYGSSPYVGSSSAFQNDTVLAVGGDPHRRPPDPIYGDTAYPRSSSFSTASPGTYGGSGLGRARSSTLASLGSATPASPSSLYGGAFSPFSVEL
ncbi:hypothetical protein JCM9279_005617 [Rhodotorula babjevae]